MPTNAQFYQLVDSSIKQGLTQQSLALLIQNCNQDQTIGPLFDLPVNVEYLLRRLINACMSTDVQIRGHSSEALDKWITCFQIHPNVEKLTKFLFQSSNYKKAGNRKSETEAFAAGRVAVIKCLHNIFKNNSKIFQSLNQIIGDFPHLEQEVVEACHLISQDKILKLKFQSLTPKNISSRFLFKLLARTKDPKLQPAKIEDFNQVFQTETQEYPKRSIVLYNFGKYLHTILDVPNQFFRKYANRFLDNEEEAQVDIHQIYSLMTILKGFLDNTTITSQNYKTCFDKKIIAVWLEQFRVLNKKMKNSAKQIKINFQENNPEFSYQVLVDVHEEGIYMDNVSINHPLSKLYQWVDVNRYWEYLYNLCTEGQVKTIKSRKDKQAEQKKSESEKKKGKKLKQKNAKLQKEQQEQEQEQAEQPEQQDRTYYNQLQFFIKLRVKELADQHISKTIILLLNRYNSNKKSKQGLYLCINLLNLICSISKNKKKNSKNKEQNSRKLNTKMILVLNKIDLSQLNALKDQEGQSRLKQLQKCILWGRKNTLKIRKEEGYVASEGEINFFNFYHAVVFFCLIYPEEIETCSQLQLVYKDLLVFYQSKLSESNLGHPKKKVKRQKSIQEQKEQIDKPIHVLNDIFMSLMTKPPAFLRRSIHYLYENIIPFLNESDIGNMLAVISTPDAQFIEEI